MLISHRFAMADAESAFRQALDHPGDTGKVIIDVVGEA